MTLARPRALRLPPECRDELVRHARKEAPREAVGFLAGVHDEMVERVVPLVSRGNQRSFFVDPYSQYRALRVIQAAGFVPIALYHSHPGGCSCLSMADRTFGEEAGLIQVVVALTPSRPPRAELAAYRLEDGAVQDVEIVC
jgi:proteasome lid subunit RPN8/RPN11